MKSCTSGLQLCIECFVLAAVIWTTNITKAETVVYDTASYWPTVSAILSGMGPEQTSTSGETFVAPTGYRVTLNDFSFYAESYYPYGGVATLHLRAFVYAWSGNVTGHGGGAAGNAVYLGPSFAFSPPPRSVGWIPLTASLGADGLKLDPGQHYVIGFTMSDPDDFAASQGDIEFQTVPARNSNYSPPPIPADVNFGGGGAVWFNNGNNFDVLNTTIWDTWGDIGVMAFKADFTVISTPPPAPPTIICPEPLTLECTNGSAVGTVQVGVLDTNGLPLQVVWTVDDIAYQTNGIPSGGSITAANVAFTANFGDGEHTVVVSVSNGQTIPASCYTTVTVSDTIPPHVLNISATPNMLRPLSGHMIPVNVKVDAFDDCDPSPEAHITEVTCNQPASRDWKITGPLTVDLRAKRLFKREDRIYTIHVEVIDFSGNKSTTSVKVTVPLSGSALIWF